MAFAVSNVAVTNGAGGTLLVAAGAEHVVIMNNGPNAITLGVDSTVTTGNGFLVPAGATVRLYPSGGQIQAIAAAAAQVSPADTRVWSEI